MKPRFALDRRLEVAEVNARGGLPCRMLESFQVKVIGSSNKFLVTSRKSTAAFLYCTIWAVVFTTVLSCILEHVLRLLRCDLDPTDRRDDGCFKHIYNCCAADKHDQHTRISLWRVPFTSFESGSWHITDIKARMTTNTAS